MRPIWLVVDDNPGDVLLMKKAMTRAGLDRELHVVRDGETALQYLTPPAAVAPEPELIILDLSLPRMGGVEVLERLRAERPGLASPVLILTSSGAEVDVEAAYRFDARAYVEKPSTVGELSETLSAAHRFLCVRREEGSPS